MNTLVLLLSISAYVFCQQPPDPVWPDVFQQSFKETLYYPIIGSHDTSGTFYYDYPNKRYRVDRENGRFDRYCGFNGLKAFQNTRCSHLVLDGVRWLIYPDKNECCKCCDAAHGCNLLKPTWLSNATFMGKQGEEYVWNQPGAQPNYYHERASDRVMTEIKQVPNDDQFFDPDSLKTEIDDADKVFALPSYCKDECSVFSVCWAVQHLT